MKSNLFIAEYFKEQGCLNIEQGVNLWHLLNHVLWADIPGDVVELGCLSGITSAVIGKTIQDTYKSLYLYDSFEGLSQPTKEDGEIPFIPENFKVALGVVVQRFDDLELPQPTIVPGWFKDTLPQSLPDKICFAHIDADLYVPTLEALNGVYSRLSKGAIVLVDDYCCSSLAKQIESAYQANPYCKNFNHTYKINNWVPAVKRACDEFLDDLPEEMTVLICEEEKHAFFRKVY